jgi:Transglutaminase-like superfamily
MTSSYLFLKALLTLIYVDFFVTFERFAALRDTLPPNPGITAIKDSTVIKRICSAVDLASICYWKRVLCLQRSAAATRLLRSRGIPAQLVLAAQQLPFRAHAWVEVDGRVVNDKPYVAENFRVLDRW